eukprot:1350164-Amphidinium_carterae.1
MGQPRPLSTYLSVQAVRLFDFAVVSCEANQKVFARMPVLEVPVAQLMLQYIRVSDLVMTVQISAGSNTLSELSKAAVSRPFSQAAQAFLFFANGC